MTETEREEPVIDPERMEATLEQMALGVEAATDDALDTLREQRDIDGRTELYQTHGFAGETVTVEVEMHEAELFAVMDMLDRVTDQPLPAHQFVPAASALSRLIRASPVGSWGDWLAESIRSDAGSDAETEASD